MGEFDPVSWDEYEATLGTPSESVVEYVDRMADDVADEPAYAATKEIYDTWKREEVEESATPPQGAVYLIGYLLEQRGILDPDEGLSLVARRPDDDQLREWFWENEETLWWIAVRTGVHYALVTYWMREADVPLMERNLGPESMATVREHRANE